MISIFYGDEILEIAAGSEFACNIPLAIQLWTGLEPSDYYCTQHGRRVASSDSDRILPDVPLRVWERLPGGKGGFGSMLRAIGAQIEKTTNREACRDLSGRRLRDINEEKRLKSYLEKQQEAGDGNERVKAERKITKLLSKPKHEFQDTVYEHDRSELVVAADEAIQEGMHKAIAHGMGQTDPEHVPSAAKTDLVATASSSTESLRKRKLAANSMLQAKRKTAKNIWLSPDLSSSSDTDDDADGENQESNSVTSKSVVA